MKKVLDFVTDQIILLADLIRTWIKKLERKMYGFGLPRFLGIPIILSGILGAAAGVVMLVIPGPGMAALAFGIALIRIGYHILTDSTVDTVMKNRE